MPGFLSICLFANLPACLSVSPSTYQPVYLFIIISLYRPLNFCPSVGLPFCLHAYLYLSLYLSACLPVCLYISKFPACQPLLTPPHCPTHLNGHLLPRHGLLQLVVHHRVVDTQAAEDGKGLTEDKSGVVVVSV